MTVQIRHRLQRLTVHVLNSTHGLFRVILCHVFMFWAMLMGMRLLEAVLPVMAKRHLYRTIKNKKIKMT